jgi:hypothetical protein
MNINKKKLDFVIVFLFINLINIIFYPYLSFYNIIIALCHLFLEENLNFLNSIIIYIINVFTLLNMLKFINFSEVKYFVIAILLLYNTENIFKISIYKILFGIYIGFQICLCLLKLYIDTYNLGYHIFSMQFINVITLTTIFYNILHIKNLTNNKYNYLLLMVGIIMAVFYFIYL